MHAQCSNDEVKMQIHAFQIFVILFLSLSSSVIFLNFPAIFQM